MDILKVFKNRRSVRKYLDKLIPKTIIDTILEYVFYAPTGANRKPVEVIVIDDKNTIEKIRNCRADHFKFLETAPLCFVVLVDEKKSTAWQCDASIAAIYIQLLAQNFDLASCWGHVHNRYYNGNSTEECIRRILNVPNNFRILCVIGVGYPNEKKAPHSNNEVDKHKIHFNKY